MNITDRVQSLLVAADLVLSEVETLLGEIDKPLDETAAEVLTIRLLDLVERCERLKRRCDPLEQAPSGER